MPLIAYSLRRAVGALIVLLIVIWLIQFAVYHASSATSCNVPRGCVPTAIERNLIPWLRLGPGLADEWTNAGRQVGLGLLVALGARAAWRIRRRRAG